MKIGVYIAWCLLLFVPRAEAMILPLVRPLSDVIAEAPVVAHVRIKSIHERRYRGGGRTLSCGRDYVVEVLTTFKGRPLGERTFSALREPHPLAYHEVKPGDELLVALRGRRKEEIPAMWATDVIDGGPTRAEIKCRRQLSLMTLSFFDATGFPLIYGPRASVSGQTHSAWIAYSVVQIEMPRSLEDERVRFNDECEGLGCTQPVYVMVPWEPLKAEIHRWVRASKGEGSMIAHEALYRTRNAGRP
jgi:hypothetical protein